MPMQQANPKQDNWDAVDRALYGWLAPQDDALLAATASAARAGLPEDRDMQAKAAPEGPPAPQPCGSCQRSFGPCRSIQRPSGTGWQPCLAQSACASRVARHRRSTPCSDGSRSSASSSRREMT